MCVRGPCCFIPIFQITIKQNASRRFLQNCEKRLLASSRLSVRIWQLGSHWTDFHEIWYLSILSNIWGENSKSFRSDKNNGYFTWRPIQPTVLIFFRSFLHRMRIVSAKSCGWNQNTHFIFNNDFSQIVPCRAGQTTDDNMGHAHCMLDTEGYRHTQGICNNFCFYAAVVVARTRLNVTQHVHCSSCVSEVHVTLMWIYRTLDTRCKEMATTWKLRAMKCRL